MSKKSAFHCEFALEFSHCQGQDVRNTLWAIPSHSCQSMLNNRPQPVLSSHPLALTWRGRGGGGTQITHRLGTQMLQWPRYQYQTCISPRRQFLDNPICSHLLQDRLKQSGWSKWQSSMAVGTGLQEEGVEREEVEQWLTDRRSPTSQESQPSLSPSHKACCYGTVAPAWTGITEKWSYSLAADLVGNCFSCGHIAGSRCAVIPFCLSQLGSTMSCCDLEMV